MKKLVITLISAVIIASCSTNADKNTVTDPSVPVADSKEFDLEVERARKEMLDSINLSTIRQRTIDSMNAVAASKAVETKGSTHHTVRHTTTPAPGVNTTPAPATSNPATTSAPTNESPSTASSPAATSTTAAAPEKKKGLNNAVKGALIGLGTGAAAGAIIDKDHRGKGAIIGGVIGATGGAVGGAVLDKNKKKKAKQDSIDAANGVQPK